MNKQIFSVQHHIAILLLFFWIGTSHQLTIQNPSLSTTFRRIGNLPLRDGASPIITTSPIPHPLPVRHDLYGGNVDKRPYHTNDWWTNWVLDEGSDPIQLYPYVVKGLKDGLFVSMPLPKVSSDGRSVMAEFDASKQVFVGAREKLTQRKVDKVHSKLGITSRWSKENHNGYVTSFLLRGQTYVTLNYVNLTPLVRFESGIESINDQQYPFQKKIFSNDALDVKLRDGSEWIIYSGNREKSFDWILMEDGMTLSGLEIMNDFIRLVRVFSQEQKEIYDKYRDAVPIDAQHEFYISTTDSNTGKIVFKYDAITKGSPLLLFVLPHHLEIMNNIVYPIRSLHVLTTKGNLTAVLAVNNQIEMIERLTDIEFDSNLNNASPSELKELYKSLILDQHVKPTGNDSYFFGKQIAKMGRLALIADQLGDIIIATNIRNSMKHYFSMWITNSTQYGQYIYEKTYGGIVSWQALSSKDVYNDFGNAYYNDHHFHWGYHVYAAAVIMKSDSNWTQTYKNYFIDLVRDYASPVRDNYFPDMRMKDIYTGISFAAGLFTFERSKNQESTSESINAYYGMYLLGKVLKNDDLYQMGRLLLAMELRSAKNYWHMPSYNSIYNYAPSFKSHKMVGIVWEVGAQYQTWFGNNTEFIHCIQMMPFTPITEEYLSPKEFIIQDYSVLQTVLNSKVSQGWKGFIYMAHSIFNKSRALQEINTLTEYDDGNSRTNTLYWVITRPA